MCMCGTSSFKGHKHTSSICNLFFSFIFTGIGQNWVKLLYFLSKLLRVKYLLMSFAIVVIINKAFKLFQLVLEWFIVTAC